MKNISNKFNELYEPYKALLIYKRTAEKDSGEQDIYVESYDIGKHGNPINAHPLSLNETLQLSTLFQSTQELKNNFLQSKGVLPHKVLFINSSKMGYAVWYTPPQKVNLFFINNLDIPCGMAKVPAMVWKASNDAVSVFALKGKSKPDSGTALYHAPYFNIYNDGKVCMGTVKVEIEKNTALEDFMTQWESYFFNSYFSHLMNNFCPVSENIVQLWQAQTQTERDFPVAALKKNGMTIKSLLS